MVNDVIASAGDTVEARQGVRVEHVAPFDTADAMRHVIAERQAGVETGGAVDLISINGAEFA